MIKINIKFYFVISVLILSASSMVQNQAFASHQLDLGTAEPFVILAGDEITNGVSGQLVTGDTGHVSTLSNPFTYVTGSDFAGAGSLGTPATLGTPLGDARAVYDAFGIWDGVTNTGLACTFTFADGAIDLAADTTHGQINQYEPGVYCINGAASIGTAGININATGTVVFKINGAFTTVSGSSVTFSGTASSNTDSGNLYFASVGPAAAASMFGTEQFSGTVMTGLAAITVGANTNATNARFISESDVTIGGGANIFTVPPSVQHETPVDTPTVLVKRGDGDDKSKTKPTFGTSYQTNKPFVIDGFGYDTFTKTITDNFHTQFDMVDIPTGVDYTFFVTGYFANELKIQEFCFGVPEAGQGYLAESCVEVHFDSVRGDDKNITDIKVVQDSEVIGDVSAKHEMVSCNVPDNVKACDKTTITVVFLEPLNHKVMMIKGIDWKARTAETYLNEGFNIDGKQFTELPTAMIPSPTKYEGLIKVTESEKYSDIWISDDGRTFERNSYGTFTQINQSFEIHQDTGDMKNRNHSAFAQWKIQQALNAKSVFNSDSIQSVLPDSFTIMNGDMDKREQFLIDHNMMWIRD